MQCLGVYGFQITSLSTLVKGNAAFFCLEKSGARDGGAVLGQPLVGQIGGKQGPVGQEKFLPGHRGDRVWLDPGQVAEHQDPDQMVPDGAGHAGTEKSLFLQAFQIKA